MPAGQQGCRPAAPRVRQARPAWQALKSTSAPRAPGFIFSELRANWALDSPPPAAMTRVHPGRTKCTHCVQQSAPLRHHTSLVLRTSVGNFMDQCWKEKLTLGPPAGLWHDLGVVGLGVDAPLQQSAAVLD